MQLAQDVAHEDVGDAPIRGSRHRLEPAEVAPLAGRRHANANARPAPDALQLRQDVDALFAQAPTTAAGDVDIDVLTEQLLAQLSVTESTPAVLDVDRVPGGKWGLLFGGMALVAVVGVIVIAVLGVVLARH